MVGRRRPENVDDGNQSVQFCWWKWKRGHAGLRDAVPDGVAQIRLGSAATPPHFHDAGSVFPARAISSVATAATCLEQLLSVDLLRRRRGCPEERGN
jgi:hypothetical protein